MVVNVEVHVLDPRNHLCDLFQNPAGGSTGSTEGGSELHKCRLFPQRLADLLSSQPGPGHVAHAAIMTQLPHPEYGKHHDNCRENPDTGHVLHNAGQSPVIPGGRLTLELNPGTTLHPWKVPVVIDPRGTRFSAAITVLVLAAVILTTPSPLATVLLSLQTMVFAMGAILGPSAQPYGWLFRSLIRPRLAAPREVEDALPPQFSQAIGLLFGMLALVSAMFAWSLGVWIFAGFALFAAALNAVFGFCLGCEIYLRIQRYIPDTAIPSGQRKMGDVAEPQWAGRPAIVDLAATSTKV